MRHLKKNYIFYAAIAACIAICSSFSDQTKIYPTPSGIDNLLFYVQRTTNINTLVYELNINAQGELNLKEPIKIYWINYAKDSSREPLTAMEKKKAYGIEAELIDPEKKTFRFNLTSYRQKSMFLMKSPLDNKYHAYCNINSNMSVLNRVFIQTEGSLPPKIKRIDLAGKDPVKSEESIERIVP
ncbi:MAG: DUF4833 domain-containing protein [Bacteroidia bacterium]